MPCPSSYEADCQITVGSQELFFFTRTKQEQSWNKIICKLPIVSAHVHKAWREQFCHCKKTWVVHGCSGYVADEPQYSVNENAITDQSDFSPFCDAYPATPPHLSLSSAFARITESCKDCRMFLAQQLMSQIDDVDMHFKGGMQITLH